MNEEYLRLFDTMSLTELAKHLPERAYTRIANELGCTASYVGQLFRGEKGDNSPNSRSLLLIENIRLEAVKLAKNHYQTTIIELEKIKNNKIAKIKDFLEGCNDVKGGVEGLFRALGI